MRSRLLLRGGGGGVVSGRHGTGTAVTLGAETGLAAVLIRNGIRRSEVEPAVVHVLLLVVLAGWLSGTLSAIEVAVQGEHALLGELALQREGEDPAPPLPTTRGANGRAALVSAQAPPPGHLGGGVAAGGLRLGGEGVGESPATALGGGAKKGGVVCDTDEGVLKGGGRKEKMHNSKLFVRFLVVKGLQWNLR